MKPYFEDEWISVYVGDVRDVLPKLLASLAAKDRPQMCISSPPYLGLRDYGVDMQIGLEATPAEFTAAMVTVFDGCRSVLKDDGTLWLNLGDSYAGSWGNQGRTDDRGEQRDINGPMMQSVKDGRYPDKGSNTGKVHDGFKPKDLMLMPFEVARALRDAGWWLRQAFPWTKRCLSGGTWVYVRTQKGDMPMTVKDMVRLRPETVQLWNGTKWTQVKGFHRTAPVFKEMREYVEIVLRSGERLKCTADHRWPLDNGRVVEARHLQVGDTFCRVKMPEPDVPVSPQWLPDAEIGWFIGLYLAEGCMDRRIIHLAGHVNETESRRERLEPIVKALGGSLRVGRADGNRQDINISGQVLHGVLRQYIYGDSARNKCLTAKCWQRSDVFLTAVLSGYLEGDGHWDARNERWRLGFCENDNLARDLRTMCARLGADIRLRRGTATAVKDGPTFGTWKGQIRMPDTFTVDPEKHAWTRFKPLDSNQITEIGRAKSRVFWDVEVEDEPHVFALASGILTHNSAMPGSQEDRATTALEWIFQLAKKKHYFYDAEAVRMGMAAASIARLTQDTTVQDGSVRAHAGAKSNGNMKAVGKIHVPGNKTHRGAAAYENGDLHHRTKGGLVDFAKKQQDKAKASRDRSIPTNRNGEGGHLDETPSGSRGFRNTDLFYTQVDAPHGLIFAGDEIVGIDCNPAGFSGEYCAACKRYYHDAKDKKEIAISYQPSADGEDKKQIRTCICGRSDAWLSHFATFPMKLVTPFIRCGTSEAGECEKCGKAWVRVTDTEYHNTDSATGEAWSGNGQKAAAAPHSTAGKVNVKTGDGSWTYAERTRRITSTLGFIPQCECDAPARPQTVLDPFGGAGTTMIVAAKLGRRCISIELNEEYAAMSIERYKREMRKPVDPPRREEAMPLFAMVEKSA